MCCTCVWRICRIRSEDDLFRAPTIIEDGYTAEEIEFSILE